MDQHVAQQGVAWLQQNVDESITKDDLLQKARGSDLPGEVTSAFEGLHEGEHDRSQLVSVLEDRVTGMGVVGAHHGGTG